MLRAMADEVETFLDGNSYSPTNESATKELIRDIEPDFAVTSNFTEKQSKSIGRISGVGQDEMDAGPSLEEERCTNENNRVEFSHYNMTHKSRGLFVIFNHKTFEMKNARVRTGTNVDRDNLLQTAKKLGFEAISHENLTQQEVIKEIQKYANRDYKDCDSFACAVLTHGEAGDVLYAKDGKYSVNDLLSPFRETQSLIGKPKMFFVQACRGKEFDEGLVKKDEIDALDFSDDSQINYCCIPAEADFFIGYCTVEGYYAWRNGENGSWFVQALCFCLNKYGSSMELMRIMTLVNQMVAYDFRSNVNNPDHDQKKQMPSVVSRLTADVYFRPSKIAMNTETIDGIFKADTKGTKGSNKPKDQETSLKKKVLETKLELARLLRKKAEVEMKEQDLRQKLIECQINRLK